MITQNLIETKDGMINLQAEKIWNGEKTLIVNSRLYRGEINKFLYLLSGNMCYGIIKLQTPEKINLKQFEELSDAHVVTKDERKKWWPHKEILFAYKFTRVTMFDKPKKIKLPNKAQTFVKDFDFMTEMSSLKNIGMYDSTKIADTQLMEDWKIAVAWYSTKKSGGRIKHSVEDIVTLAGKIYKEVNYRKKDSKKCSFHPSKMAPLGKELYNRLSKRKVKVSNTLSTLQFAPMRTRNQFYDLDKVLDYMFQNPNSKYALEKKLNGQRAIIVKKDSNITILSNSKEMDETFKIVLAEATQLSTKDLILDGEMVGDTSKVIFHVFDLMKYDEEGLSDKPWHERKRLLHSLNFSKHIQEVSSIIVDNKEEAMKGIRLLRNLSRSKSVVIKRTFGKYTQGGKTDDWIEFNNLSTSFEPTTTETEGIAKVSGQQEGKKITQEQGKEDPTSADWDKKTEILGGIKYTSYPIVLIDKEYKYLEEGHTHQWSENRGLTSIEDGHKHKINTEKMIAEEVKLTDKEFSDAEKYAGHTHLLIIREKMADTTTSSPGIPSVQGSEITSAKKKKKIKGDSNTHSKTKTK